MKITAETVRVRASRTGTIYTAPGEEGHRVRDLVLGEEFLAKPKREGRWAKVSTVTGRKIGYTKSKRLEVGDDSKRCSCSDFWGYVDPKKLKQPYSQSRRQRDAQPVVVTPTGELVDGQHRLEDAKENHASLALERLAQAVETRQPPLPDPARGRFAFFDRFCTMRERNRTPQKTGNDVQTTEARFKFATSLIRTAAVAGSLGYLAHLLVPFLG